MIFRILLVLILIAYVVAAAAGIQAANGEMGKRNDEGRRQKEEATKIFFSQAMGLFGSGGGSSKNKVKAPAVVNTDIARSKEEEEDSSSSSAYQLRNVEKVFFASPEEQAEALKELRARLSSSKDLACKEDQISDGTLKRALWAKRNNVKSALSVVLGYCSWYKKLLPAGRLADGDLKFLGEHPRLRLKIEDVEKVLATGLLVHPLQVRDTDGFPVVYAKVGSFQPDQFAINDIVSGFIYILEVVVDDPAIAKYGITTFGDMSGVTMSQMNFGLYKQLIKVLQGSFPIRIHAMIIYNPPTFFSLLWAMVKHLFNAELQAKIKLVRNREELKKLIDEDNLPPNLQGKGDYSIESFIRNRKEKEREGTQ